MQQREHGEGRAQQEILRADLGARTTMGRRSFLRGTRAGLAGVVVGASLHDCSESASRDLNNAADTHVRLTSPPSAAQATAV